MADQRGRDEKLPAVRTGIGRPPFVLVSTDKAVNPTSVMGASKRMAELAVRSIGEGGHMKCVITRFGNVLDSNGSVIPLFRRQIENGGPVTRDPSGRDAVLHDHPRAVQLVMEAAATSAGDDIFVFDMGERVRIADLARRMIRLAGLVEETGHPNRHRRPSPGRKASRRADGGQGKFAATPPQDSPGGRAEVDREAVRQTLDRSLGSDWNEEKVKDALGTHPRIHAEFHPHVLRATS